MRPLLMNQYGGSVNQFGRGARFLFDHLRALIPIVRHMGRYACLLGIERDGVIVSAISLRRLNFKGTWLMGDLCVASTVRPDTAVRYAQALGLVSMAYCRSRFATELIADVSPGQRALCQSLKSAGFDFDRPAVLRRKMDFQTIPSACPRFSKVLRKLEIEASLDRELRGILA